MHNFFDDFSNDLNKTSSARTENFVSKKRIKRFYTDVCYRACDNNFIILLDDSVAKTPSGRPLEVPSEAIAKELVKEFLLQKEEMDPSLMPLIRFCNTVIDGVKDDVQPIVEDLLNYCKTDLLFYRASSPKELAEREALAFDPILDWAQEKFCICFAVSSGIMPIAQDPRVVTTFGIYLKDIVCPFTLAALHVLTTITGSFLLALALKEDIISFDQLWHCAYIEEDWSQEKWGEDVFVREKKLKRLSEAQAASQVLKFCFDSSDVGR